MLETKAILLGTDAVGKTKLLYKLKLNEDVQTIPTIGFNVETISYKDREITIWDVGGGDKIKIQTYLKIINPKQIIIHQI